MLIYVPCHVSGMQIMPDKVGPWGGVGGQPQDVKVTPHRLRSVKICSGVVIDAITFSYEDRHGKQHTTPLWGGIGGNIQTVSELFDVNLIRFCIIYNLNILFLCRSILVHLRL